MGKVILIRFIKNKLKHKFVKNVLTLFSGSVLSQAILFAFIPVLTRLYPEEVFGLFFIYTSLTEILRVIASLQFERAIVLPKNDTHAINLLAIALIINLLINLLFFLLIFLFYEIIIEISSEDNIGKWFYYIPLSSFLLGSFEAFSFWNNRLESYKIISFAKISKSTTVGTSQIFLKYLNFQSSGLFMGVIIGQFVSYIYIIFFSVKSISKNLKYLSVKKSIVLIKKYKDIPLYNTLLTSLNTISNQIPILLLAKYFGAESAAYYGIASRVVMTPMGLISESVGQVFYKTSSDIINKNKKLFTFVKKTYFNLAKIAVLPVIIIFVSTYFFDIFFGETWYKAGQYTRIMLPWLTIAFLNRPVSWLIVVLNKQKIISLFDFILLILRFLAIYLSYKLMFGEIVAIYSYSLVGFLFGIFIFFYLLYISKSDNKIY